SHHNQVTPRLVLTGPCCRRDRFDRSLSRSPRSATPVHQGCHQSPALEQISEPLPALLFPPAEQLNLSRRLVGSRRFWLQTAAQAKRLVLKRAPAYWPQ